MKVAIVGSRNFPHQDMVEDYVNRLPADTVIVSGGAKGVDTWGVEAAEKRGLDIKVFEADWNNPKYRTKSGKSFAGMLRNTDIIKFSDRVTAFSHNLSKGTQDSRHKAMKEGKVVDTFYSSGIHTRTYVSSPSFTGDFAFLSNAYASPLTIDGIYYVTIEHAYRATQYHRQEDRQYIAGIPNVPALIEYQRVFPGAPEFQSVCLPVMESLLRLKFKTYPRLWERLVNTGKLELISDDPDPFWGGAENNLGKLLMKLRTEYRAVAKYPDLAADNSEIDDHPIMHGSILYVRDQGKFFEMGNQAIYTIPVNTKGVMGKGLALAAKERWPEIEDTYLAALDLEFCATNRPFLLSTRSSIIILMIATKENWREPSRREWIKKAIKHISLHRTDILPPKRALILPKLGCGAGGLDWQTEVRPIYEKWLREFDDPVYVFV